MKIRLRLRATIRLGSEAPDARRDFKRIKRRIKQLTTEQLAALVLNAVEDDVARPRLGFHAGPEPGP